MKCIITGSSGFVGSRLARALRHLGNDVIGVDPRVGPETNRKGIASREVGGESVDVLFHCGGLTDVASCQRDPLGAWESNVVESIALARQVTVKKAFVYTASYAALTPHLNIYGRVKEEADFWLSKIGMPYASVQMTNVFGLEGDGVISRFLFNRSPKIRGSGLQKREFIYIDDIVDILIKIGTEGLLGKHLVGGFPASVLDIAKLVGRPDLPHTDALPFEIENPPQFEATVRGKIGLKEGILKMCAEAEDSGLVHYYGGKEVFPSPK